MKKGDKVVKREEFRTSDSNKTLPELFKELEQARYGQATKNMQTSRVRTPRQKHKKQSVLHIHPIHITLVIACVLMIIIVSTNRIFATDAAIKEKDAQIRSLSHFETNQNTINMNQVIKDNISIIKTKEVAIEEREIPYGTIYTTSDQLPDKEEVVVQEGENGLEQVKVVKNYENDAFVNENILEKTTLAESKGKMIQVGTSEFLKKHKIHIGDTLYLTEDTSMKKEANEGSQEVVKITRYLDVTLLQMVGEWCKVSYNNQEGYLPCEKLTSEASTPKVVEQNRIQKILVTVEMDMDLNKPSGLTLKDFKRVLSNHTSDVNQIFEDNAEAFYNVEQKYKVNGIFLAALGIHESGWGTSAIAMEKKNLFGYGAYDSNPYDGAYTFETYEEGIDLLGKVFAKHYINSPGVKVYDNEVATGKYYNGSTVSAINIRYCTDENWAPKVFSIMELLYAKL